MGFFISEDWIWAESWFFLLDGNSEHVMHVRKKTGMIKLNLKFAPAVDLVKCLKQIKLPISIQTCALSIQYKMISARIKTQIRNYEGKINKMLSYMNSPYLAYSRACVIGILIYYWLDKINKALQRLHSTDRVKYYFLYKYQSIFGTKINFYVFLFF